MNTRAIQLKEPFEYLTALERLREQNEYAKNWKLRVERHTNRHPATAGGLWGWYEVHPLGLEVGYWGAKRDDLRGVDLSAWNRRAEAISS